MVFVTFVERAARMAGCGHQNRMTLTEGEAASEVRMHCSHCSGPRSDLGSRMGEPSGMNWRTSGLTRAERDGTLVEVLGALSKAWSLI